MFPLRRRASLLLGAFAVGSLVWAVAVALTGGVSLEALGVPFSSREPVRPLVMSVAAGVAALVLGFGPRARVDPRLLARLGSAGALAVAGLVLWLAIDRGSFVAGGADSSSYLSQARLWQGGLPRIPQPLALEAPWPDADATLSPLGFCPCAKPDELVPIHPAGYPLAMAAARAILGPGAEFAIVPAMAAGLVLCTYLLGSMLWRQSIGLLGAALLTTSPTFLFQALQPMSDVPAAFWWTLALLLGLCRPAACAAAAACAVAAAIVTRPNLAPAGLVLAMLLFALRRSGPGVVVHRIAWVGVLTGTAIGSLASAGVNHLLYGSPLNSGYGSLAELYSLANVLPNAARYLTWLGTAETPLLALLLLSPWFAAEPTSGRLVRWYGLGLGLLMLASYLPWLVLESWTFLRFLLPAFPLLYLLLVSGALISRIPYGWARRALPIVVFTIVGVAHARALIDRDVFEIAAFEARYRTVAEYVERSLPDEAVVFSMQHSGSVSYYAGRQILRYNYLDPAWLDRAVRFFRDRGRPCYAVLESWEVADFRDRFGATSSLGGLRGTLLAVMDGISVYELDLDQ
jgi:hypothetical protein